MAAATFAAKEQETSEFVVLKNKIFSSSFVPMIEFTLVTFEKAALKGGGVAIPKWS